MAIRHFYCTQAEIAPMTIQNSAAGNWLTAPLVAVLFLWALLVVLLGMPTGIADDWNGWRQADTQTIALNYAEHGVDLLHPRINWGGDTEGYVETELQLYAALLAPILRLTGDVAWPGRSISLIAVIITLLLCFRLIWQRFGPVAAWLSLAFLLSQRGMVYLASYIQPDALSLMFYMAGLAAFLRYADSGSNPALLMTVVMTTMAALIKPNALNLGIFQFGLLALTQRERLFGWRPWLAWTTILVLVAAYYLHARQLYLDYGNTFGIASGGDSKFPHIADLFKPGLYLILLKFSLHWGVGLPGILAGLWLLWRRKLDGMLLALIAANIAVLLVSLRYTTEPYGSHYYRFSMILGAFLIAAAVAATPGLRSAAGSRAGRVMVTLVGVLLLGWHLVARDTLEAPSHEVQIAADLRPVIPPGSLLIIRSPAYRWDARWQTVNNFEDPRTLYLLKTRGWVIARDDAGEVPVSELADRAAFYVEPLPAMNDAALSNWLANNAMLIHDGAHGRAWQLRREGG